MVKQLKSIKHTINKWLLPVNGCPQSQTAAVEDNGQLFMGAVRRVDGRYNVWSQECAGMGPSVKYHLPWHSDKQRSVIINHEHYLNGIVRILPLVEWNNLIVTCTVGEKNASMLYNSDGKSKSWQIRLFLYYAIFFMQSLQLVSFA